MHSIGIVFSPSKDNDQWIKSEIGSCLQNHGNVLAECRSSFALLASRSVPIKTFEIAFFSLFLSTINSRPPPLIFTDQPHKMHKKFRDLPELEALPSTTRHTWRIHLCHHYVFAITTSLPSWYLCHHYIFAIMISLPSLYLCQHDIFVITTTLRSLYLCGHYIFAITTSLPSWYLCHHDIFAVMTSLPLKRNGN